MRGIVCGLALAALAGPAAGEAPEAFRQPDAKTIAAFEKGGAVYGTIVRRDHHRQRCQPKGAGAIIGAASGIQLVEEPQSLLGEGQRQASFARRAG